MLLGRQTVLCTRRRHVHSHLRAVQVRCRIGGSPRLWRRFVGLRHCARGVADRDNTTAAVEWSVQSHVQRLPPLLCCHTDGDSSCESRSAAEMKKFQTLFTKQSKQKLCGRHRLGLAFEWNYFARLRALHGTSW
jgi:hypothetical protein